MAFLAFSSFCIIDRVSQEAYLICELELSTHGVLAEGKWHILSIASDLDKDSSIFAELAGESRFQGSIISGLRKAGVSC